MEEFNVHLKLVFLTSFINRCGITSAMNFQSLATIETPTFYLDLAFRRANDKLKLARQNVKKPRFEKSKQLELLRIEVIKDSLMNHLKKILISFPSIDTLPKFYNELVKVTLDYPQLKKSLGAVNWCTGKIDTFFMVYKNKIKNTRDLGKINQYRREFNGRVSSVLRQIKDNLAYLEGSRRIMKGYPSIKTSMASVVITGFPNVGKTTLMYNLTGSKAEINSYPFTTKNINLSYLQKKVQLIDVPGTLDRPDKMNSIEKQADLALKYCCDLIIYVMDLTEPYPLDSQLKLLDTIKKYDKETWIFISKEDITEKKKFQEFSRKYHAVNIKDLTKKLLSHASNVQKQPDEDISDS